jgi:glyoxylase-like metal-dependent hydrolase (beta-lactamase superfamily II)
VSAIRVETLAERRHRATGTPSDAVSASSGLTAFALDGTPVSLELWLAETDESTNVIILHTPGHSPGSISLYKRPSIDGTGLLFTGDTYGYTTNEAGHTRSGASFLYKVRRAVKDFFDRIVLPDDPDKVQHQFLLRQW